MTTGLPPKPDPQTGEPRPPRAPLEPGWKMPGDKHKNGLSKVPQPPEGEGPLLEWFYPTRGTGLIMGTIMSVIMIGFFTLKDFGFSWMTTWWLWLFVLPWPLLILLLTRNNRLSAGADWLGYDKHGLIKTYELTKVEVTVGGFARYLVLEDRNGNAMRAQFGDLQQNRELWDLVYNGILHSVHAHGAQTNKMARDYLRLNLPPQFYEQG